ncbi:c-type cytochrome [Palleronia pelagia]|uniref:Cytochrome C oxidase, cbb3-type, subunit III n=1 Tax=Palleronia pelagia TaxID=387096 RepID=A0A1H8KUW1_9RHOB|nr:c-type cytochrome [Palleronia pelagia]SEN96692.1 Cytochrome C oxidase, cbb3-type, subunit III [Palleronia pelagia]
MITRYALIAAMVLSGGAAWAESHASESEVDAPQVAELTAEDVDMDAAGKIFQRSCRGCHGNKAQGAASYPKLSDKEPQYLADMLARYRDGERIGPNSILMIQNAKDLSDEDITNLSV